MNQPLISFSWSASIGFFNQQSFRLPGDEIISVDGIDVYGKHAEDVAELIKSRSNLVVLTVKPAEKSQ